MANEAVLIIRTGHPIPMTVAEATGIEKGAVLKMADLLTASSADGANDIVAGIGASEKVADDGKVKLGVYRGGIFRMYISGSVSVGDPVGTVATYTNFVASNFDTAGLSGSRILGIALETGTNGETILVELKPIAVSYL